METENEGIDGAVESVSWDAAEALRDDAGYAVPETDIVEGAGGLYLYLDVPGASPARISVRAGGGNVLAIEAGRAFAEPSKGLLREFASRDFRRAFRLGSGFDAAGHSASLTDGTLTVFVPRRRR